jgi:hypothetical protein
MQSIEEMNKHSLSAESASRREILLDGPIITVATGLLNARIFALYCPAYWCQSKQAQVSAPEMRIE